MFGDACKLKVFDTPDFLAPAEPRFLTQDVKKQNVDKKTQILVGPSVGLVSVVGTL